MQNILDQYIQTIDPRTSLFDVRIDSARGKTLTLSGRILDLAQLDDLHRLFPTRNLDTASIRILNSETHEHVHVATNLTGLYERPTFGMPLSSELTYGTPLEVLDTHKNWVFTRQADGYLGWAYRPYLAEGEAPGHTHLVIAPVAEVRAEPDPASAVITRLVSGTGVGVVEKRGKWSKVAANQVGWIPSVSLRAVSSISQSVSEKRTLIIEDTQRMIGVPYLWGGVSGNGIDCSGFAQLVHRWAGLTIPRDADMQHAAAHPVKPPYKVGDLFFFAESESKRDITHVGISLGGWKMMHSSRGRNGVYLDDLLKKPSLMNIFVGAGSFLR